jgi:hypothetical protein
MFTPPASWTEAFASAAGARASTNLRECSARDVSGIGQERIVGSPGSGLRRDACHPRGLCT